VDPRLLRAYNEELSYLREAGREFGLEHEVVAGYLGLKTPNDPDPYVERLLEGVAFLAARVNLKIADQFPEFTQHLLQAVQPNYLAPTPSICVVELKPEEGDEALARGVPVERNTKLTGAVAGHDTPVTFRTGHRVELLPLKVSEVEYLPTRASVGRYAAAANVRAEAGLRLRFQSTAGPISAMSPRSLPLHLTGPEVIPGELYRQLAADAVAVVSVDDSKLQVITPGLPRPAPYGFDDDCALLPHERRAFRGYRILSEYFACPERFLFVDLQGLDGAFARSQSHCDIVILFNRTVPALIEAVGPANLRPFCTPAINLFEMQLGRTPVSPFDHEHQLIPDRTRPLDYEVFQVLDVTAYGRTLGSRSTAPLYAFGALLYDWQEAIFHVSRVRLRRMSTREQRLRRRNDYVGTETYVSLTTPAHPERLDDIYELGVRALVTNRELPELLRFRGSGSDLTLEGAPVSEVTMVRAPTRPRPPLGLQDGAWRVISHLTPNYASLINEPNGSPDLLKDHLALYGRADDPVMRRQVDGVLSVNSRPVTRRVSGVDRLAFGRGLQARIRLDDASYENGRMLLFSAVLDRFLAEFASVNSFVETVFESQDQGEVVAWPTRTGQRPTI
jgi:type VI secretion system VasI/ImpG family protein